MKTFVGKLILFIQVASFVALQSPYKQAIPHDILAIRNAKATEIRRYMNLSADPCTDFYEFACGNWPKAKQKTETLSPRYNLELRVNRELQDILMEQVTIHDGNIGRKVKDFYISCMDAERVSKTQNSAFKEFIVEFGGFPALPESHWDENGFNWIELIGKLRFKYGLDILIGLEVNADYQNQRENRIYIREPSTLISADLCNIRYTSQMEISDTAYETVQKEIADNLRLWFQIRDHDAARVAGDIVSFEFGLCKHIHRNEDIQDRLVYGKRWFKQYPRQQLGGLTREYHGIDFYLFVTTSFGQPIPETVYVKNEEYLQHLSKVMRTVSKTTVANYIVYKALLAFSFPNDDGVPNQLKRRAKLCTDKVREYFPTVIGEMYHKKFYKDELKTDVEEMWAILKKSFNENFENYQQWLDKNTQTQAKYKLNFMQMIFPSYVKEVLEKDFHTLRIERGNFWKNIENLKELEQKREIGKLYMSATLNRRNINEAYDTRVQFIQMQNIIRISFALLQPPFYHLRYPNSVKFAQIGFQIGREMIHGFDEEGWNYDQSGKMRFWWDEASNQGYRNRSKCFQEQYSNYLYDNPEQYNNHTDIMGIIADSGGLNTIFKAYLMWLETIDDHQTLLMETLPDVDFTNTQLFFLSFAQSRCISKYAEDGKLNPIEFLPMDSHTPDRYRVNGPLANFKEFAREFNCASGRDMNPADKCLIY